ncbi:MBL fold metallo-hydrolase [Halococcus thailandensis]|uniref:Beta-lactamase domain protein n=1 Tax=Halococcus thailandensis JCM 13552 TaxID=1227457 RepID=M0MXK3_9EURY|nr:MBL fold metallo-hydrolase [Halococcus thailandensis]EMA50462.1 beta-lactamase domain protein [Halococcus thailandensis JCM 13552]
MVHSDWDDWLVREIDAADPDGVALWYLGCNGFAITDGETTLFIDPYLGTGDPPRTVRMIPVPFAPSDVRAADAIFATHEHTDHVHGPSQAPILEATDATFYGPADSIAVAREEETWTDEWDVAADQLAELAVEDTVELGEFTVTVETAHDPDATQPVSYVVDHPAGTFFHGGDTKPDASLEAVGERHEIDLGVLAFGSTGLLPDKQTGELTEKRWYCDENEIVEAAGQLRIDRLVPTHWDMWKGLTADPTALSHHARSYDDPADLEIVEIGDRIEL